VFDAIEFERLRRARATALGAPLRVMDETGSTNDDALAAARAGARHGATFVAEHQTRGRGRRGRSWHAEPGANLLFSVVLRLALPLELVPALALASGLAVRSAIARSLPIGAGSDERVRVKWPNDVWLDQKKVAGVLSESQIQAGSVIASVVGIGINARTTAFPPEITGTATSLTLSGSNIRQEELLVEVLAELESTLWKLARGGMSALHAELTRHDALAGRPVRVEDVEGIASGFDTTGRLLVRLPDGELRALASGSVELAPLTAASSRSSERQIARMW